MHEQSTVAEHPLYWCRGGWAAEDLFKQVMEDFEISFLLDRLIESTEPAEQDCSKTDEEEEQDKDEEEEKGEEEEKDEEEEESRRRRRSRRKMRRRAG